jgi:hypothetical protein
MTTAPVHLPLAHAEEGAEWRDDAAYLASTSGRLACATLAFALLGAAWLALFGNAANMSIAIPVITLGCIMGGFLTTGTAVEHHGTLTLAYLLSLPPVAGAYFAGLYVIVGAGLAAAVILAALAAIPVTLMVRARIAG